MTRVSKLIKSTRVGGLLQPNHAYSVIGTRLQPDCGGVTVAGGDKTMMVQLRNPWGRDAATTTTTTTVRSVPISDQAPAVERESARRERLLAQRAQRKTSQAHSGSTIQNKVAAEGQDLGTEVEGEGVFWLTLAEFTACFNRVYTCYPPHDPELETICVLPGKWQATTTATTGACLDSPTYAQTYVGKYQ